MPNGPPGQRRNFRQRRPPSLSNHGRSAQTHPLVSIHANRVRGPLSKIECNPTRNASAVLRMSVLSSRICSTPTLTRRIVSSQKAIDYVERDHGADRRGDH
jgi:hypothetical protein